MQKYDKDQSIQTTTSVPCTDIEHCMLPVSVVDTSQANAMNAKRLSIWPLYIRTRQLSNTSWKHVTFKRCGVFLWVWPGNEIIQELFFRTFLGPYLGRQTIQTCWFIFYAWMCSSATVVGGPTVYGKYLLEADVHGVDDGGWWGGCGVSGDSNGVCEV